MKTVKLLPWLASCALLALAGPVGAGVYKCMENGKLVYSDRMCDAESTPLDTGPALGGTKDRRSSYQRSYPRRPPRGERMIHTPREAARGPTVIDRTDPETIRRCAELKTLKARLARSGGSAATSDLEQLDDLTFSNCYGHVNGNQ